MSQEEFEELQQLQIKHGKATGMTDYKIEMRELQSRLAFEQAVCHRAIEEWRQLEKKADRLFKAASEYVKHGKSWYYTREIEEALAEYSKGRGIMLFNPSPESWAEQAFKNKMGASGAHGYTEGSEL